MKFTLRYVDVLEEYDNQEYVKFRWSFTGDHRMLEINLTLVKGTSYIYNFIKGIKSLYQINKYEVIYKNMKYIINNDNIHEVRMY